MLVRTFEIIKHWVPHFNSIWKHKSTASAFKRSASTPSVLNNILLISKLKKWPLRELFQCNTLWLYDSDSYTFGRMVKSQAICGNFNKNMNILSLISPRISVRWKHSFWTCLLGFFQKKYWYKIDTLNKYSWQYSWQRFMIISNVYAYRLNRWNH